MYGPLKLQGIYLLINIFRRHKGEFANYDFLAQTVQTVIDAVTDMAGATCYKSDRYKLNRQVQVQ